MTWDEVNTIEDGRAYWQYDESIRPTGKILTKKQYDYVLEYGKHAAIKIDHISSFKDTKGKYITLGSLWAGAAFYFKVEDRPESVYKTALRDENGAILGYKDYFEDFSYGKYGKIDFNDEVKN